MRASSLQVHRCGRTEILEQKLLVGGATIVVMGAPVQNSAHQSRDILYSMGIVAVALRC